MGTATEQQPPPSTNEFPASRESAVRAEPQRNARSPAFQPPGDPSADPSAAPSAPPTAPEHRNARISAPSHGFLLEFTPYGRTLRAPFRALRWSGEAAPTARSPTAPPRATLRLRAPRPAPPPLPSPRGIEAALRPPRGHSASNPRSHSPHPAPRPLLISRHWRRCGRRFPAPRPPPPQHNQEPRNHPTPRSPPTCRRHTPPLPDTHAPRTCRRPSRTHNAPAQHSAAAGARPAGRGGAESRGGRRLCGCSRGAAAALHPPPRPARSLLPSGAARRRLAGARAQGRAEGAGKKRAGPRSPPGWRGKGTAGAPPAPSLLPFVPATRAEVRRAGRMGIHEGAWLCKARPLSSAGAGRGRGSEWAWLRAVRGRAPVPQ